MDAEIRNAASATDQDAQYDDKAKRLLENKIILVKTVDEFKGMNPKDVVSYIEGELFISVVPVEPARSFMRIWGMCGNAASCSSTSTWRSTLMSTAP